MPISKVSIPSSLSRINQHWKPKLVASINGQTELKVVKLQGKKSGSFLSLPLLPANSLSNLLPDFLSHAGEFVWHDHQNTDEVFYLLAGGPLTIQFREEDGGDVVLQVGEMLVIPRGVEHCPKAENECSVLLAEGVGTVNDGEAER